MTREYADKRYCQPEHSALQLVKSGTANNDSTYRLECAECGNKWALFQSGKTRLVADMVWRGSTGTRSSGSGLFRSVVGVER